MKTFARLFTLMFAATLFTAPLPTLAQQKQDTMDKKDSTKKSSKKKSSKKKSPAKKADDKNAPAPGPK